VFSSKYDRKNRTNLKKMVEKGDNQELDKLDQEFELQGENFERKDVQIFLTAVCQEVNREIFLVRKFFFCKNSLASYNQN
jgi:hypothetical protein